MAKFEVGWKGGPGRPPGPRLIGRCKEFMNDKGWDELEHMALDKKCKDRLGALKLLAAYGFANPPTIDNVDPASIPLIQNITNMVLVALRGRDEIKNVPELPNDTGST